MKALRKINKLRFLKARRAAIVEMAKKGEANSVKAVKEMINAQLKAPEVTLVKFIDYHSKFESNKLRKKIAKEGKEMEEGIDYKWKV